MKKKRKISTCVYVHSILHHWACILILEGHFIEYVCWWEFVCELLETLIFGIHCNVYFESETGDLLLGALDHCPFHHYIHCWCDFISCLIWVDHYSSSCYLLRHHPRFAFDSSHLPYPCPSLLTLTYSRFEISLASLLRISLSVWFASLSHYWCYIHIGHLQVQGSRAFLYMLQFIHKGMGFSFLSPYRPSIRYVPCLKTTLRPWDQMSSSTTPTWTCIWDLVNIWISSCFFFWEGPLWCLDPIQLWIWITGITRSMMNDLMSPDFLIYHTFKAILGHISVRLRFIDLHGFAGLSPFKGCTPRR